MKKTYEQPKLIVEVLELDDVIASSGTIGGDQAGDVDVNDPFGNIWG